LYSDPYGALGASNSLLYAGVHNYLENQECQR
jgi:hypothetical protein